MRDYFLGFARLPGALAVSATPFLRLPAPDLRRRNLPIANDVHYEGVTENREPWGGVPFGLPEAVLIDPKGRILYSNTLEARNERMLNLIMGALLRPPA